MCFVFLRDELNLFFFVSSGASKPPEYLTNFGSEACLKMFFFLLWLRSVFCWAWMVFLPNDVRKHGCFDQFAFTIILCVSSFR